MADDAFGFQVDSDWKKQAQEEKRRLAEQEARAKPADAARVPEAVAPAAPRAGRDLPQADFVSLVQTLLTQALFYLGELSVRGQERVVDLDAARRQVDLLGVVDQKTTGNLSADERRALDSALYQARMRFVSVASQYVA